MKVIKNLILILLCTWLLCGCGNQKRISGRVVTFENGLLTVQTENGKTYDFQVDSQRSTVFDLTSKGEETLLDDNCRVNVNWSKKQGTRYAEVIWVEARLQKNVMQLSDGTVIDLWEHSGFRDYCLEDGTELLMEETYGGPENNSHWNELLYYEEFPEAARQGILSYYAEMGLRYDVAALLEDAWQVYQFSEEYNTKLVGQHIGLEAWNDKIICCQMNLTIPQERTNGYADYFAEGAVFDRKTGEHISGYDLFTLTPEELEACLLDQLDTDGSLDRSSIQLNLQPEQIVLQRDGSIEFFLADRVEVKENMRLMLQIGLQPEQAKQILQPWAVIEPRNDQ